MVTLRCTQLVLDSALPDERVAKLMPFQGGTTEQPIRELNVDDLPSLAELLAVSFPRHSLLFWRSALGRLQTRSTPEGTPQFGYGLGEQTIYGAALAISSYHGDPAAPRVFTNISSWCVLPSHRGLAAKELYRHATEAERITFTNLSAAAHTIKTISRFGFREWTAGQVIGVGLGRRGPGSRHVLTIEQAEREELPTPTVDLLRDHEALGCVAFCVATPERLAPFIFLRRRVKPGLSCAQLIYCERLEDFTMNSRAIHAWLFKHGFPAIIVDASGPVEGMRGHYFPGKAAKYYKGPAPALAVDHSYSEMVYIGF